MLRKLALLAAISPALWLSSAAALGLGEIDVKSALNQRFAATIPLTAVSAEEAESVQISLASYAEFQRAGLERSDYLSSLKFAVSTEGGAPRIEISSGQIAREPFVNFLVEVRSRGNRLLREYTVLLDPPGFQAPPSSPPVAVAPAQPVAPPVVVAPAAAAPKPAAPAPRATTPDFFETSEESANRGSTPAPAAPKPTPAQSVAPVDGPPPAAVSGGDSYGPVKVGETFWSIAAKLRDPSVTMPQMLLAIYEGNRGAFDGGINSLRVGSTLQLPSLEQISAVSPTTAKARVDALRAGGSSAPAAKPRTPAVAVTSAPAAVAAPVAAPKPVEPKLAPKVEPAPVAKPAEPSKPVEATKPVEPAKPVVVPPPAAEAAPVTPPPAAAAEPAAPVAETPAPAAPGVDPGAVPADATAAATTETPVVAPVEEQPATEIQVEEIAPVSEESEGGLIEWLIPLLGLALVIGGVGYLITNVLKKRKEAGESKGSYAAPASSAVKPSLVRPVGLASTAAAKTTAADLQRLDETMNDATANFETQQFQTQQIQALDQQPEIRRVDSTVDATSQLPTFDSTQNFGLGDHAPKKSLDSGNVDFDLTGQFAAETVQINLDANDPVAEADFHLAYGLYDEAILLLKQAAQKDPGRSELGVKLAETYFAAGRPMEFQETAESLQGRVDPGSWQKIAIMGQQLCPDSDLFKGAELGAMSTDVDLLFDEPAATELPEISEFADVSGLPEIDTASKLEDNGLEFRLEELELPKLDATVKAGLPELKNADALEFDLGDFDLSNERKPSPAVSAADKGNEVEFDIQGVDLGGFDEVSGTIPAKASDAKVHLDDFDLGDLGGDSDSISSGDETSTKLDLARAYVDMGDNEMARSLLSEVLTQGTDAQKNEAQTLIARLS